jgi:hypothetical protein
MGTYLIERFSDKEEGLTVLEGFIVLDSSDECPTFSSTIHGPFGEDNSYVVTQDRLGLPGTSYNHEVIDVTKSKPEALQLAYGCTKAFCEWFNKDYDINYEDRVKPEDLTGSGD